MSIPFPLHSAESSFIPYGYQYYRWPTPNPEDWESDLEQIASMGFNTVKYFIYWRISHPEPDRFMFEDVKELMDIAGRKNLKVILNILFDVAPAWFYQQYPESKMIAADGTILEPVALASRSVGGAPGPCFHHAGAEYWKGVFLQETVAKFKDHPALWVWDLWNEPELTVTLKRELSFANQVCYCTNCLEQFPRWLAQKYESIQVLNEKWQRNYVKWTEVEAPRVQGLINDLVDWRLYFVDTLVEELHRRIRIVKSMDREHPVMCHTVPIPYFNMITAGSDDFRLAEPCDLFGNSVGSSSWASDLFISAAKGKKMINAEIHSTGGDMVSKNRKLSWKELKKQILIPLSRGTTGFIFWQYRPETLGLEAPAWGATYMDGRVTPWLTQSALLNQRIQEHKELICHGGRMSDRIAILFSDEGQIANFAVFGHLKTYENSLQGAHKLLHDLNYKVEFIHQKDVTAQALAEYDCLWMPFPIYMNQLLSSLIMNWVEAGGFLISECSFGMLQAENGRHSRTIPGYGFDKVFGVREQWIHSIKHRDNSYSHEVDAGSSGAIPMTWLGSSNQSEEAINLSGAYYQSEVECSADTTILARFDADDSAAITLNSYGKGKAVWIGSLLAAEYWERSSPSILTTVQKLLQHIGGVLPKVVIEADGVRVDYWQRSEENHNQCLYYVQNMENEPKHVEIPLNGSFTHCKPWFEEAVAEVREGRLHVELDSDDFQVFLLYNHN